jgi:uncharacterized membrane protein
MEDWIWVLIGVIAYIIIVALFMAFGRFLKDVDENIKELK